MQLPVNLKKAYENKGKEISKTLEKFATLMLIDDEWKEHLRENGDELKQSSQNAVFEQKDPLLIYKLESFNLFQCNVDTSEQRSIESIV
jgi:preprotein translocase subunit SecA